MALAEQLRLDADFLRYLEPRYTTATELRARAEAKASPLARLSGRGLRHLAGATGVRLVRRLVEHAENCLPPPAHIERYIAEQAPDVVLVTHLAEFGSTQTDYVRAAKRLGIHTAYPVFSWDNLTNKGLVHDLPELLLVWNDLQAAEAAELHDVPPELVRVTGSPAYDHWFDWGPDRSREEFCREVGLEADRPIILYACSSAFVAPDEVSFVRRWIEELRAAGGRLAEAGVIVRIHPRNSAQWAGVDLDEPQATIWPRFGEEPLDAASRRNYFDSIYHSAAIVGINTSAQIESAIIGRPVHTVLAEEFRDTQQGTLHFHYLKADDFGHLFVGRTMQEHTAQLEDSLRGRADDGRNERFLKRFVRPFGLDVAATPLFVDTIEELAARPAPMPDKGPALGPAIRLVAKPLVSLHASRDARQRTKPALTPLDQLRSTVRRLGRDRADIPVVAGPWLADEIGELLYWIPFLRWVQVVTFGIEERLVIIARTASAPWYTGVDSRLLLHEEIDSAEGALGSSELRLLPAGLVEERRADLSARHPADRFLRRFLEFAPLQAPALPGDLELPDDFTAVRFSFAEALPETAENVGLAAAAVGRLVEHGAVVVIDPPDALSIELGSLEGVMRLNAPDRGLEAAILARARAFVGSYGPSAYAAILLGRPAVAFYAEPTHVRDDDLRLAGSFLGWPPFGRLNAVHAKGATDAAVADAVAMLFGTAGTLAGIG